MVMRLKKVAPLGRSLDEYRRMFALSENDLDRSIMGVGDGTASFNAEMHALGNRVVSIDPLFAFGAGDIEKQFYAVVDDIIDQVKATPDDWEWSYHRSPEQLKEHRMMVLRRFLADYGRGTAEGRYVAGELPRLTMRDGQFELALCSHFLFLYSDHFTYDFHRDAILDMLRVAHEVRIFPLLTLMLKSSPYVKPLMKELTSHGFHLSVERVNYELQKGGNEMLRIRTRSNHYLASISAMQGKNP